MDFEHTKQLIETGKLSADQALLDDLLEECVRLKICTSYAEFFIAKGAKPNSELLKLSVEDSNEDYVKFLINKGLNPNIMIRHLPCDDSTSVLLWLLDRRHFWPNGRWFGIFKTLLQSKACPDFGSPLYDIFNRYRYYDDEETKCGAIDLLLKHGADHNSLNLHKTAQLVEENSKGYHGFPKDPLKAATFLEVVKILKKHNVDLSKKDDKGKVFTDYLTGDLKGKCLEVLTAGDIIW